MATSSPPEDSTVPVRPSGAPRPTSCADHGGPTVTIDVVAGPDVRGPSIVGVRRIVVGRHPDCTVRIADDTAASHHALLIVDDHPEPSGDAECVSVTVVPLVGARRTRVDGRSVSGPVTMTVGRQGRCLTVGCSLLRLSPAPPGVGGRVRAVDVAPTRLVAVGADRMRVAHRPFGPRGVGASSAVRLPSPPPDAPGPTATALVGAFVGLGSAAVVAAVLGSVVFMVFGAVAAAASLATWVGSWIFTIRRRRRDRWEWEQRLDRLERELGVARRAAAAAERRRHLDVGLVLREAETLSALEPGRDGAAVGLWTQQQEDSGADASTSSSGASLPLVVGVGRRRWTPRIEPAGEQGPAGRPDGIANRIDRATHLDHVPVAVAIARGRVVAVSGRHRCAVVRSALVSLAWRSGPVDWRLVVVTDRPGQWRWIDRLPHTGSLAVVDATAGAPDRGVQSALEEHGAVSSAGPGSRPAAGSNEPIVVVVVDGVDRELLDLASVAQLRAVAGVVVVADEPPSWADEAVRGSASGRLEHEAATGSDVIHAHLVGVSSAAAEAAAFALSGVVDPQATDAGRLPATCGLVEVHLRAAAVGSPDPTDPSSIARRWAGCGADPAPVAVVGTAGSGPEVIDVAADGPHALVVGTTGAGKSELLRTWIASLAVHSGPEHLTFVLVDYKGGAAFDACAALPHVLGVVTDLDRGLAERVLRSLRAELRRRSSLFREVGASDMTEFRVRAGDRRLARLVVVIDEFAAMAADVPDFVTALVDVAQRGRSLGVHLVLATQRPGGVVGDDIRANTALRLALRTQEAAESTDVLGRGDAAALPRSLPGRALRRAEGETFRCFQVASGSGVATDGATELESVVAAVTQAAQGGAPHAPLVWLPPLPARIDSTDLGRELAMGGVDESPGEVSAPIGVIDDPDEPCRRPLRWTPGDGMLLIVGAVGSGATSTLLAIAAAACASAPAAALHLYVIDARGDGRLDALAEVAHCGGVVRPHESERMRRLLERVCVAGDEREQRVADGRRVVVLIDGLDALRQSLQAAPDVDPELATMLRDLLVRGRDRGVEVVATAGGDALPPGVAATHTWVGAVDDQLVARSAGWTGPPIPPTAPGRFGVVGSGLVAQVARGAPGLAELPTRSSDRGGPATIARLPTSIAFDELDAGGTTDPIGAAHRRTMIGRCAETFVPDGPVLAPGRHLLVVGRPASGVSSTLATIAARWRCDHGMGEVVDVTGGGALRSALDRLTTRAAEPDPREVLVVIDDADRIPDDDGRLVELLADGNDGFRVTVVAGVRLEALRSGYGHWTRRLAANEHGIALARTGEAPTDALGAAVPRRPLVSPRAGLGWLVDRGAVRALQIARPPAGRSGTDHG